jgi:hypothetical protein
MRLRKYLIKYLLIYFLGFIKKKYIYILYMSIVGPTGPQGPQGERGKNGRMGLEGPTGPAGSGGGGSASLTVFNNPSAIINNTYTIPSGSSSSNIYLKDCTITTGVNRTYSSFVPGLNSTCNAFASSGTDLYVGGDFTIAGGITVNRIAKYNTVTRVWSALGTGLNGSCRAIAISGTNVYVGGEFSLAGGNSASNIAVWNGSTWSALGSGLNNVCGSLAISGTDVYVGGQFTATLDTSPITVNKIAKYNTSTNTWSPLGSGLNDECMSLLIAGTNLYVGGSFTATQDTTINLSRIAVWNITNSTWSPLSGGLDSFCRSMVFIGLNLYACGRFTNAINVSTSISANNIAKYDTSTNTWSPLGSGLTGGYDGRALAVIGTDLYVVGDFNSAGGSPANYIAKWNTSTSTWSALGNGLSSDALALAVLGTELYIGGGFTTVGNGISSNRITSYTFNYINLVFNSQIISTLYNNSAGSQVNTYLSGGTTYASVDNISFYQ